MGSKNTLLFTTYCCTMSVFYVAATLRLGYFPGVAQLVERHNGVVEAAGSSPVTRTNVLLNIFVFYRAFVVYAILAFFLTQVLFAL